MRHSPRPNMHVIMRAAIHRALVCTATLSVMAACASDAPTETHATPAAPPATNPISQPQVTLSLATGVTSLYPGEHGMLYLTATYEGGGTVSESLLPSWTSSDPAIAIASAPTPRSVRVLGVAAGSARITATLEGKSVSVAIGVLPRPADDGSMLEVESFTMIEFQYPSAPDFWFYAPQLRVRANSGGSGVAITRMEFDIPGLGAAPPCNTDIRVDAGAPIDLFREIYGDYHIVFHAHDGHRATGGDATAFIATATRAGTKHTAVVKGVIVPGTLPTTYSGGNPFWQCSFFP
jgi:hypothetical protein